MDAIDKRLLDRHIETQMETADSVLAMLMIGDSTVRRQWFLDPLKARNERLVAIQLFDNDLRRIRHVIFDSNDSRKFEQGIGALLFLLGFSPCLPVETESPDLILTTPGRKIVLVECTLKMADFSTKLGKLVDRCRALSKQLSITGLHSKIYAMLICATPRDQIAMQIEDLNQHKIQLLTREDLESAFQKLKFPNDPDALIDEGQKQFPEIPIIN